ncbi:ATP-binding protein [Alkalicoccus saliphilus]|uniref:histidine kinase n=1 Tax=Alkalicoccus saliphilus TaxID=200989 RepID=A0A2T4U6W8_9BACI|nr:sensor histidine kinase [Alkalicoccus saliphilus]PTL39134.1 sensor histidine kinase [Alkalicoccus saliphilus]
MKFSLLQKMIALIIVVVFLSLSTAVVLLSFTFNGIMYNHFGERAMDVAKITASNEQIAAGFEEEDPSSVINPIAEEIRTQTGASYVVVGNLQDIRYSHHNPAHIGEPMGTSNDLVFENERSIVYIDKGVSGEAAKAKTPIYNEENELIGVSSVGFLRSDINDTITEHLFSISKWFLIPLLLGITGSFFVSRNVKKSIFNLEPEEISYAFKEKEAILESIHDATMAVDTNGEVVSINKKAREIPYFENQQIGKKIQHQQLIRLLSSMVSEKIPHQSFRVLLSEKIYLVNASAIMEEEVKGIVLTLRSLKDVESYAREFSQIKEYKENMRVTNHEHLNKLNTIYGLLKLNKTEEATLLISKEVEQQQDVISFLMESVSSPLIVACLLGKKNRASEKKVSLTIDTESCLSSLPSHISEEQIVTIVGNIIDNALESVRGKADKHGEVLISFTDIGNDIIFDIEDNGPGISQAMVDKIFLEGFTSKTGGDHGLGLAIVTRNLKLLNGEIIVESSQLGGARFTVIIPKTESRTA